MCQQLEAQWEKFADSVPAWHLAVQNLKDAAELDQTAFALSPSAHPEPEANGVAECLEQAISNLLIWAQTIREKANRSSGSILPKLNTKQHCKFWFDWRTHQILQPVKIFNTTRCTSAPYSLRLILLPFIDLRLPVPCSCWGRWGSPTSKSSE